MNVENDMKKELNRWMRPALAAFAPLGRATDQLTDQDFHVHLVDTAVPSALCYAAETSTDTAATSRKLLTTHRTFERCHLKFNRRIQCLAGLCSSDIKAMSSIREPVENISKTNNRYPGHIMRRIGDRWTKRTKEDLKELRTPLREDVNEIE
ncbi:hypothetical protein RB195_021872 [Necator americanus]|uniref:Uncharacterized protein n=1 Tax=Necator americanus TaxID=51031 RepID=A0ABR1EDB0_NECAM